MLLGRRGCSVFWGFFFGAVPTDEQPVQCCDVSLCEGRKTKSGMEKKQQGEEKKKATASVPDVLHR